MKVGALEFVRTKSKLADRVYYQTKDCEIGDSITATPSGIEVDLTEFKIESEEALQEFAKLVSEVWADHLHLRIRSNRKIVSTLAGH